MSPTPPTSRAGAQADWLPWWLYLLLLFLVFSLSRYAGAGLVRVSGDHMSPVLARGIAGALLVFVPLLVVRGRSSGRPTAVQVGRIALFSVAAGSVLALVHAFG